MKQKLINYSIIITLFWPVHGSQGQDNQTGSVGVFILDDQTGEELKVKHGILPLGVADLELLINAVVSGKTPVRLHHQAVDEDSRDNGVSRLDFRPFEGGKSPVPPSPNLPFRRLIEATKQYQQDRAEWQRGIHGYASRVVGEAEDWSRSILATQNEIAAKFDRMLRKTNGRDFNRSDIVSCVSAANLVLGSSGQRFLIINSDAKDLPYATTGRSPRSKTFTKDELDPGIEIIFVNTSRIPDQASLFKGVENKKHHADSMSEAMKIVILALEIMPDQGRNAPSISQKEN